MALLRVEPLEDRNEDRIAIQTAIDNVARLGGGEVILKQYDPGGGSPKKKYLIDNTIHVKPNVTLRGEHDVINNNTVTPWLQSALHSSPAYWPLLHVRGHSGIRGLHIEPNLQGNPSLPDEKRNSGVWISGVHAKVEYTKFFGLYNGVETGVSLIDRIDPNNGSWRIENCYFGSCQNCGVVFNKVKSRSWVVESEFWFNRQSVHCKNVDGLKFEKVFFQGMNDPQNHGQNDSAVCVEADEAGFSILDFDTCEFDAHVHGIRIHGYEGPKGKHVVSLFRTYANIHQEFIIYHAKGAVVNAQIHQTIKGQAGACVRVVPGSDRSKIDVDGRGLVYPSGVFSTGPWETFGGHLPGSCCMIDWNK